MHLLLPEQDQSGRLHRDTFMEITHLSRRSTGWCHGAAQGQSLHGSLCVLLPSGARLILMPGRPGAVPGSCEVGWRALSKVCALPRQQDTAWSSSGSMGCSQV